MSRQGVICLVNLRADLQYDTPPDWAKVALSDFTSFLQDHANMERKASAQALSFVVRYPDRTAIIPLLIETAREELEHFQAVYLRMAEKNIPLAQDQPDPYINSLLQHCRTGRDERFIDRMLLASIVETRGAERFRLISEAHFDAAWKTFYRDLWACEAKHGNIFIEMLFEYFPAPDVMRRQQELAALEADIVRELPWRASLH